MRQSRSNHNSPGRTDSIFLARRLRSSAFLFPASFGKLFISCVRVYAACIISESRSAVNAQQAASVEGWQIALLAELTIKESKSLGCPSGNRLRRRRKSAVHSPETGSTSGRLFWLARSKSPSCFGYLIPLIILKILCTHQSLGLKSSTKSNAYFQHPAPVGSIPTENP